MFVLNLEKPTAVVYPDFRQDKDGRTSLVSISRQNLVIPEGKLIRLMCQVTGSPEPKVSTVFRYYLAQNNFQSVKQFSYIFCIFITFNSF